MLALEVHDAVKRYADAAAIAGVSFEVEEGEPTAILGPSGCGKTTTLRAVAGLVALDAGTVRIFGTDVTHMRPFERRVGLVFQGYALFPHMTVAQNIGYGLRLGKVPKTLIEERVTEALETVRLTGFEGRWPRQLSGGEQQRVALARAIVTEPAVLLLDEPLSNLDAKLRREMRVELKRIFSNINTTPIIVTHDQTEALGLGEKLIVMKEGTVEQVGTPSDVYFHPATKFVADFIGDINWFEGSVERSGASNDIVQFHSNSLRFRVAEGDWCKDDTEYRWLGVRPERVNVAAHANEALHTDEYVNVLSGTLERAEILGEDVDLVVRLESGQVIRSARKNSGSVEFGVGKPVSVQIRSADCIPIHS